VLHQRAGKILFSGIWKLGLSEVIAIFARFPRLGEVKTRLAAFLGEKGALELYEAFLLDTIERLMSLPSDVALFLADSTENENMDFAEFHALPESLRIYSQRGSDLGQRMWNAYGELSVNRGKILFVGADSPNLPLYFFSEAYKKLNQYGVVWVPAADGGYCLLGLSKPLPNIFRAISWGTPRVLNETREKLGGKDYYEFPQWYDVDDLASLKSLITDLSISDSVPPRTANLLKSGPFKRCMKPEGSSIRHNR